MIYKNFRFVTTMMIVLALIFLVSCTSNVNSEKSDDTLDAETGEKLTDLNEDNKEVDTEEETITLNFWTHFSGGDEKQEFFDNIGAEYQIAHPEANVIVEHVPVPWDDYIGVKMRAAFTAGNGPDVYLIAAPLLPEHVTSGAVMPLNDYYTEELKDDYYASITDIVTMDGNIYTFPFSQAVEVLYYDMELFEKEGLSAPKTWDELLNTALKLTTDERYGLVNYVTADAHIPMPYSPFIWSNGGAYVSEDGKTSAVNSKEMIESLSFVRELMTSGAQAPKLSRAGNDIGVLADGETAMQICGTWGITSLELSYPDKIDSIGIVPIPVPDNKELISCFGGWGTAVNPNNEYTDEAAKFAKWFSCESDETALKAAYMDGALPARKSLLGTETANNLYASNLWQQVMNDEIMSSARGELVAPPEVAKIVQDMLERILFDTGVTPEQIVEEADIQMNEFLLDYDGAPIK
jgi:multiple sugar transport system substrate-binding protein